MLKQLGVEEGRVNVREVLRRRVECGSERVALLLYRVKRPSLSFRPFTRICVLASRACPDEKRSLRLQLILNTRPASTSFSVLQPSWWQTPLALSDSSIPAKRQGQHLSPIITTSFKERKLTL